MVLVVNLTTSLVFVACSGETEQGACDIWSQIQYTPTVKAIMVSDNQLDQYFQFVKDMLLEEVY